MKDVQEHWKPQNSSNQTCKRLKQMEGYTMVMDQRLNIASVMWPPNWSIH